MESGKKKTTSRDQHKRFIETARTLECDEDKERLEAKLKRIVELPGANRHDQGGKE